jgi:predicted porin
MMKKSLVALAALAVVGIASAQSSVTLFGVLDAGVSYSDSKTHFANGGSVKQSQWSQSSSGYNSSRIGFRGTEDLGGGLAASFWLEAGLGNDTGAAGGSVVGGNGAGGARTTTSLFNRRSTVSLSGNFGEVRIGRDYTASAWNDTVFDPFGFNGSGSNLIAIASSFGNSADGSYPRASNMVGYFLPKNLGGFYGQVQYGLAENVKTTGTDLSKAGRYVGGRFGYANGPLDVAVGYGESTLADVVGVSKRNIKTANLGATYDFGVVKAFAEISQAKNTLDNTFAADSEVKAQGYLVGATVPVGPGLIRVSYSAVKFKDNVIGEDPKAGQFALGYVHNLSKRTALYATVSHISDKHGATLLTNGNAGNLTLLANGTVSSANGYDFGIRHAF